VFNLNVLFSFVVSLLKIIVLSLFVLHHVLYVCEQRGRCLVIGGDYVAGWFYVYPCICAVFLCLRVCVPCSIAIVLIVVVNLIFKGKFISHGSVTQHHQLICCDLPSTVKLGREFLPPRGGKSYKSQASADILRVGVFCVRRKEVYVCVSRVCVCVPVCCLLLCCPSAGACGV